MNIRADSTCRTCLRDSDCCTSLFEFIDGHELRLGEMLSACAGIIISEDDEYPHKICQTCVSELPSAWKFVETCRTSNVRLQKYYETKKFQSVSEIVQVKLEIKEEFDPTIVKYDISDDDGEHSADSTNYKEIKVSSASRPRERKCSIKVKNIKKRKSKISTIKNSDPQCPTCFHIAATECGLRKHIRHHHPELWSQATYPCSHCGKTFKRKSDRVVHERSHSGERPFACAHCPQRFSQSGTLILHTRRHTGETPFRCAACPRLFSCHSSLRRHARSHSGERPYACERCGATFAQPGSLRQHGRVHSEERPHACQACGRRLKSRLALRNHMLTHGDKGFVCERCGKKFFIKANLDKHHKKMHHSGAGVCSVCSKPCSDLERHMLSHSDRLHFSCPLCSQAFRTKGNLSYHITTRHKNDQKYKCDVEKCSKAFPKQSMLDFHTRKVHSNETPYLCMYCENGFFRKSDLSRHLNTVHPNEKNSQAL